MLIRYPVCDLIVSLVNGRVARLPDGQSRRSGEYVRDNLTLQIDTAKELD